jgi:hypothetical protein
MFDNQPTGIDVDESWRYILGSVGPQLLAPIEADHRGEAAWRHDPQSSDA